MCKKDTEDYYIKGKFVQIIGKDFLKEPSLTPPHHRAQLAECAGCPWGKIGWCRLYMSSEIGQRRKGREMLGFSISSGIEREPDLLGFHRNLEEGGGGGGELVV